MERKAFFQEYMMCKASEASAINFGFTACLDGQLSIQELRAALRKACQRHPLLAVRIDEQPDGAVLTTDGVPEISVRIVENSAGKSWQSEMEQELTLPFDWRVGPLVRLVWLKSPEASTLLFIFHHAIADGFSAVNLIRDLLGYLAHPEIAVEALPLLPAMETLMTDTAATRFRVWLAGLLVKLLGLKRYFQPQKSFEYNFTPKTLHYHTHIWQLKEMETKALIEHARSERTSVHAALAVAFMRAFGELDRTTPDDKRWQRTVSNPVSLRKYLNVPAENAFGFYITLRDTVQNCDPAKDFWRVAREYKAKLARQTTATEIISETKMMSQIDFSALRDADFWQRKYDLSITNLGRVSIPQQPGGPRLRELYGPVVGAGENEVVMGVLTFDNRMNFVLISDQAKLAPECAEQIISLALNNLRSAL